MKYQRSSSFDSRRSTSPKRPLVSGGEGLAGLGRLQLGRLAAVEPGHIQMEVAVPLGQEIDALVVRHPAVGRPVAPRQPPGPKAADPGVVVFVHDRPRPTGLQIQELQPGVLVVHRPGPGDQMLAVVGPDRRAEADRPVALPVVHPTDLVPGQVDHAQRIGRHRLAGLDATTAAAEATHLDKPARRDVAWHLYDLPVLKLLPVRENEGDEPAVL